MKRLFASLMLAIISTVTVAAPLALAVPAPVYAAADTTAKVNGKCPDNYLELSSPLQADQPCVLDDGADGGIIFRYVRMIIQFLSGAVGLIIVLMVVAGGLQYITSTGDPAKVKAAKDRITNAITGLVLFALMFAILNFLIPGGIIG